MKSTFKTDRRGFLVAGLASGAALSVGGCIDHSHRPLYSADAHPEDYPTVQAVKEMGRLLKERSEGRLSVKIFSGGQLGSERDTLEITSFGGLDMNRVNLAPLNSIAPMTAIPSLPFLFRSTDHLRRSLDGEPGEAILRSLEPHGLIGLCYYDSGERSFYNTKHPIKSPADMKGMKIRVQNSDLYLAMIKALGADPIPMALGDVYQSLVQGVIDGAENNWPSYESGSHYEAAQYYSLSRHVMAPEALLMSKSRWDKLPKSDQAIVRQAAKDSVPYMRELWDERVTGARTRLIEAGVIVNEVDDLAPFIERMRPVWDRFIVTDEQKRLVKMIEDMGDS
ncbi:MAG: C4-dicarboxylate ABC transporter [Robiginitomaculum sp.]|nr:MAG: C4-dicarboxylate ABC transporter [Robiginitomaculum sp.]